MHPHHVVTYLSMSGLCSPWFLIAKMATVITAAVIARINTEASTTPTTIKRLMLASDDDDDDRVLSIMFPPVLESADVGISGSAKKC